MSILASAVTVVLVEISPNFNDSLITTPYPTVGCNTKSVEVFTVISELLIVIPWIIADVPSKLNTSLVEVPRAANILFGP